eukprot:CAMPEP_0174713250 /NCGR_PEP_ID=MMETSP1094-20130205/13990_1 /TAXON_ID=156173 /ORGANISM="Chrysochromulina brevifilum, Strain UTEX LB 985" /LENGTH=53 /DNA_ID=CAMNT_0015912417 /DNA_START=70 /DNA_END=228 /DNA_ORIENTATION=-
MPRLPVRIALETQGLLAGPRRSALEDELDEEVEEDEEGGAGAPPLDEEDEAEP